MSLIDFSVQTSASNSPDLTKDKQHFSSVSQRHKNYFAATSPSSWFGVFESCFWWLVVQTVDETKSDEITDVLIT